jgi:hypothetical protein
MRQGDELRNFPPSELPFDHSSLNATNNIYVPRRRVILQQLLRCYLEMWDDPLSRDPKMRFSIRGNSLPGTNIIYHNELECFYQC